MSNETTGENSPDTTTHTKPARGFAALSAERMREIASLGGHTAHSLGHARTFTPEEARAAGRKGGQAVSRDRAHMAEIGRRGGQERGRSIRRDKQR